MILIDFASQRVPLLGFDLVKRRCSSLSEDVSGETTSTPNAVLKRSAGTAKDRMDRCGIGWCRCSLAADKADNLTGTETGLHTWLVLWDGPASDAVSCLCWRRCTSDTRFWLNWELKSDQHVDLQEVIEQCWLSSAAAVILAVSQGVSGMDRSIGVRYVPDMFQISDFIMNEEFHDYFPPGLKGPGLLLSLHENGRDLMRSLD